MWAERPASLTLGAIFQQGAEGTDVAADGRWVYGSTPKSMAPLVASRTTGRFNCDDPSKNEHSLRRSDELEIATESPNSVAPALDKIQFCRQNCFFSDKNHLCQT